MKFFGYYQTREEIQPNLVSVNAISVKAAMNKIERIGTAHYSQKLSKLGVATYPNNNLNKFCINKKESDYQHVMIS